MLAGFVIAIPLLIVSTVLLLLGRRGRKLDDRPRCPHCHYDIEAAIESHAAADRRDALRCPECGKLIVNPSYGVRVKNQRMIVAGYVLNGVTVFIFLAPLVFIAPFVSVAPPGVLVWLAERGVGSFIAEPEDELASRINARTLSQAQIDAVMTHIFERQAELTPLEAERRYGSSFEGWPWGIVVLAAHQNGAITDEQFQDYWSRSIAIELAPSRPSNWTVGAEHAVMLRGFSLGFDYDSGLFGHDASDIHARIVSLTVDGQPAVVGSAAPTGVGDSPDLLAWSFPAASVTLPSGLTPGTHDIEVVLEFSYSDSSYRATQFTQIGLPGSWRATTTQAVAVESP